MYRFIPLTMLALGLTGCAPKRIETLENEVAARDTTINQLQVQATGYTIQLSTLRAELDGMNRRNEELTAVYRDLVDDFEASLNNGNASLVVFADRTVLAIGDSLTFASGSATIPSGDAGDLDTLAALIKSHPDRRFQVEGHTDSRPIDNANFASNWELGAARAISVVDALIARGVSPTQLSAATFAESAPIADERIGEGEAANRRITVAVQTSVKETGAQQALLEAAQKAGGAKYAYTQYDAKAMAANNGAR